MTPQAAQAFNRCWSDPKAQVIKDVDGQGTDVCYTGQVKEIGAGPTADGGYAYEYLVDAGGALFTSNLGTGDITGTIVNSDAFSETVIVNNGVVTTKRNIRS
jgi:hypothetical protein